MTVYGEGTVLEVEGTAFNKAKIMYSQAEKKGHRQVTPVVVGLTKKFRTLERG